MAIEVEGCQAVCSSIAEDLPVLYGTGPEQGAQLPHTLYCEADSSEPLSERVADLALVSPPANDADPLGEDQSSAVLSAHGGVVSSSDAAEESNSSDTCAESVVEAGVESSISASSPSDVNTFRLRSCLESQNLAVERETTTTPSLMCNNSAGPAVAATSPSVLAVCAGFFLDTDCEDSTTVPWSPSMEPSLEFSMDAMPGTVNQVNADVEEELHEPDSSEAQEFTTGEVAEESSAVEQETAGTDMDSVKQIVSGSDDMELSFADSFSEKVDSECGDLEISADGTFAELELLDDETQMEDTVTGASDNNTSTIVPDSSVADVSVSASTARATESCATDDCNTCDLDSRVTEEGNIGPPKITAAIVVQSNTNYMGNSSSDDDEDDDEEDGEVESSDCESLLGRDSPSPPSVDDSSLFPSVEEVETRTGISFESSGGPSCSSPSFGSVAGVATSAAGFSNSNTADTRRKAITLIDHHFRQIIDVERDLRRYVLHKTNLNRLYQEIREEKLSSHRRQRSSTNHHHHHQQHHHHSATQNNSNNLPSSSFLSNPSVSPLTARSSSPLPFGDSSHLNPQAYNRSGTPFTMGGEPGSGSSSSSTFCRQSVYSGQASGALSYSGPHDDCQDALLEPAPKRARLSCPAEEDKENKFSSAPPTASVFGSGGHSYTPVTGAEFYHHQVGCSSASGAPSSSCGGDVSTTSTTTHYSGCNSAGSGNGYYQNQASPAYGAYYNNNSFYANNMSYTPNGHFLGNFSSSSSESNGTCNLSSSNNGNYAMATGPVEADAYNNVSNNNCNNVNNLDRGLAGFNNNLSSNSSSSCSDIIGFRSNNDIIIEHIDEEIRRQNSITSNNRPTSCPPFSSSSSSLFSSSSIFSSSSYYSQSLSSSQASSSSTPSLYNTGNSSLQYNNLNHFSSGTGWNSSYAPLYGASSSSSGPTHSSPPQQQPLQPYPCGRSSLMRGGNDFQSVVYSSLLASLET